MKNYIISLSFMVVLALFLIHSHKSKEVPGPQTHWLADGVESMRAAGAEEVGNLTATIDVDRQVEFGFREDGVIVWREIVRP